MSPAQKNVIILAICQGMSVSGLVILGIVAVLAGQYLAENPAFASLPLALQLTGTMMMTIPASLLMAKIGRRPGFIFGQLIGVAGGCLGAYSLMYTKSFELLCVAGLFVGISNAFWQYYRFAAVDTAGEDYRARAISYVLAGGVMAALIGPEVAKIAEDLFAPILFAGSYLAYVGFCLTGIMVLSFLNIPKPAQGWRIGGGRPLLEIMRQPTFIVAVMSGMAGYGLMVLVMTATPLSMVACGFDFSDTAFVIQWHAFFMFAPGFLTGHLVRWFGVTVVIMAGALFMLTAMVINVTGISLHHFWFGLVTVGVGWNFMFIGGTTLLTETYTIEEKAKTQAANDFMVFTTAAIASFSSGALQNVLGWTAVNLAVIAPALIIFCVAFWLRTRRHSTAPV
jgi:MFS family permease